MAAPAQENSNTVVRTRTVNLCRPSGIAITEVASSRARITVVTSTGRRAIRTIWSSRSVRVRAVSRVSPRVRTNCSSLPSR